MARSLFVLLIIIVGTPSYSKESFSENLLFVGSESDMKLTNNTLCRRQFEQLRHDFNGGEHWALTVMDSWGSFPPTGHLYGRYIDLGNFDECLTASKISQGYKNGFDTQYCMAHYPLDKNYLWNVKTNPRVIMVSKDPSEMIVGVCVPDSCDVHTLTEIFKEMAFNQTNVTIDNDMFQEVQCTRRVVQAFTSADICAISIFSIIGVLMVFSTIYDFLTRKTRGKYAELLLAFSIKANAEKLFKVENSSTSKDTIACLHGIRSLSIIWIIYTHGIMLFQFIPLLRADEMLEYASGFYSMVSLSGPIAVDSFFLLGGLLVTLHVYREIDRSGQMSVKSILNMYLHRYLRVFPILAATILFAATLYKFIGDGPYWNIINMAVEANCQVYWWVALLHLQNYVNSSAMCLGHTWYLSADMQFYILSPLILIPLKKWGRKFLIVVILLISASTLYVFIIMLTHEFNMKVLEAGLTGNNDKKVMLYYGFHTRAPPYLIGIILGHLLYSFRSRKVKLPQYLVVSMWVVSLTIISSIIWGPYESQQRSSQPTVVESAFFEAFSDVGWGLALAWIIFACCQGYGGVINSFLSSALWQPLSRLSYTIYVVHFLLQVTMVGIVRNDIQFSDLQAIRSFWSDLGMILSISIVMVLAFESPMFALEKCLLGPKREPSPVVNENVVTGSIETLESGISESNK